MSYSRLLPLTSLKQILTCEKQSLTVSVYPLRYAIWTLEILLKSLYFFFGHVILLGRQTGSKWILRNTVRLFSVFYIAQYCPQTVQCFQHCAILFTDLCVFDIAQYCPQTVQCFQHAQFCSQCVMCLRHCAILPTDCSLFLACAILFTVCYVSSTLRNTAHRLFSVFNMRNSVHSLLCVFDIAQYCPQTVQCFRGCPMKSNFVWLTQYAIQPLNIKTIQSTILCIINYCTVFWLSRGTFSKNYCLLGCGTCRLVKNKR
jgi:uncharacterized membrane protein